MKQDASDTARLASTREVDRWKTREVRIARRIKKIPSRLINRVRCATSVGG
jgi:hypothetical protein